MARLIWIALALVLGTPCSFAAEPTGGAVRDYEARLEEIAKDVQDLRRELDQLVQEVVEGETGRLVLFLEGPAPAFKEKGVALSVDGKAILSRPLSPAESDVLSRGLLLELAELRVPAGEHRVSLGPLGGEPVQAASLRAERGRVSPWVAKVGSGAVEWRAE